MYLLEIQFISAGKSLKGILWKICDNGSKVFLLGDMKCGKGLTVKNGLVPVETSVSRLFSAASCQYCTKTYFPAGQRTPLRQGSRMRLGVTAKVRLI